MNRSSTRERAESILKGLSLVLVEDDEHARESGRLLLELLGAKVSTASDGLMALEIMERGVADVVLCDLRMPRMDGFEFIRELRRRHSIGAPSVIAVSALASGEDRERTRETGFAAHVAKPFDVSTLIAAIETALAYRRSLRCALRRSDGAVRSPVASVRAPSSSRSSDSGGGGGNATRR